jgi:flagellar motility protein MotE (MotC chaperone)
VSEVCLISLLKPLGRKKIKLSTNKTTAVNEVNNKVKKQLLLEQRDQLKKKNIKKKERLKELEEEREKDKMKWQSFNNKVIHLVFK